MKGNSHPKNDVTINPSSNESIHQVIERIDPSRRQFLHTGIGAAVLASAGGLTLSGLSRTVEAHGLDRGPPFGQPGVGTQIFYLLRQLRADDVMSNDEIASRLDAGFRTEQWVNRKVVHRIVAVVTR